MGSRTKNNSRQFAELKPLRKKIAVLESQLTETEVSMFQAVVRLEALAKLLVEKEYITQDEFQEYINEVVDYYRAESLKQESDSDNLEDSKNDSDSSGRLTIEPVDDSNSDGLNEDLS